MLSKNKHYCQDGKRISNGTALDEKDYNHGKVVVSKDSNGIIIPKVEDRVIRPIHANRKIVEGLN